MKKDLHLFWYSDSSPVISQDTLEIRACAALVLLLQYLLNNVIVLT